MVSCSCGKIIDKIPTWLSSVKVEFVCNNCPNRQIKSISQLSMEQAAASAAAAALLADAAKSSAAEFGDEDPDDED